MSFALFTDSTAALTEAEYTQAASGCFLSLPSTRLGEAAS